LVEAELQFDPGAKKEDLERGLSGAVRAEATRSNIDQGTRWLATMLAGVPKTVGLLAYSGHGARLADDLALCPGDLKRLEEALPFAHVRSLLDDPRPGNADRLTVLLDCCYGGNAGAPNDELQPTGLGAKGGPVPSPKSEIGGRVFGAAARDEVA